MHTRDPAYHAVQQILESARNIESQVFACISLLPILSHLACYSLEALQTSTQPEILLIVYGIGLNLVRRRLATFPAVEWHCLAAMSSTTDEGRYPPVRRQVAVAYSGQRFPPGSTSSSVTRRILSGLPE